MNLKQWMTWHVTTTDATCYSISLPYAVTVDNQIRVKLNHPVLFVTDSLGNTYGLVPAEDKQFPVEYRARHSPQGDFAPYGYIGCSCS
jgi:hypothetical protein